MERLENRGIPEEELPAPKTPELTEKQIETLRRIAQGLTNAEIAYEKGIRVSSVKGRIGSIYQKLKIPHGEPPVVRRRRLISMSYERGFADASLFEPARLRRFLAGICLLNEGQRGKLKKIIDISRPPNDPALHRIYPILGVGSVYVAYALWCACNQSAENALNLPRPPKGSLEQKILEELASGKNIPELAAELGLRPIEANSQVRDFLS